MALIIESGHITEGANSYVSVEDARLYATARGISLPQEDAAVETLLIKAMDYLESFSGRFVGCKVSRDQSLSWPRRDVVIENWPWSATEIPRQVLNAQLALMVEIHAGEDPFNPPENLPVVSKSVGPVEVQYANPGKVSKVAKTSPSMTIIRTLLKHSGLTVVRA